MNKQIDRLAPIQKSVEECICELIDKGLLIWNGKKYQPDSAWPRPRLSPNARKTAAEVVIENRS